MLSFDPDALQSAHVRLLERPELNVRKPEALLHTFARRCAVDAYRKQHREVLERNVSGTRGAIDSAVADEGQPEQCITTSLDGARMMQRWHALRDTLRPEEVIAFELHLFDDASFATIVACLHERGYDAQVGTVRMWCHRVLTRLRAEFVND